MAVDEAIRKNAALLVETCQGLVDFTFGYDERSVAWLEGYIERLRASGTFETSADNLTGVFGSYLGEAIIAAHGGRWAADETQPPHILFDGDIRAFPFAKVAKQMANGLAGGDSILGFYRTIPALVKMAQEEQQGSAG